MDSTEEKERMTIQTTGTQAVRWGPLTTRTRRDVPEENLQWKDNAYLGFWDDDADIYGLFHWSASPNPNDPAAIYGQLSVSVKGRSIDVIEPLVPGQDAYNS